MVKSGATGQVERLETQGDLDVDSEDDHSEEEETEPDLR